VVQHQKVPKTDVAAVAAYRTLLWQWDERPNRRIAQLTNKTNEDWVKATRHMNPTDTGRPHDMTSQGKDRNYTQHCWTRQQRYFCCTTMCPIPSGRTPYAFFNFITHATCLAHLTLLQLMTQIMMTESTDYERLHYATFSTLLPVTSSLVGSNILVSTVFSNVRRVFSHRLLHQPNAQF
jgi:hypothetical protein